MSLDALLALLDEDYDPLEELRRRRGIGNLRPIPGGLATEDATRLGLGPHRRPEPPETWHGIELARIPRGPSAEDLLTTATAQLGELGGLALDLGSARPSPTGHVREDLPSEEERRPFRPLREELTATREEAESRLMGRMAAEGATPGEMAGTTFATQFLPDVAMGLGVGGRQLAKRLGSALTYEAPDLAPAMRSLAGEVAGTAPREARAAVVAAATPPPTTTIADVSEAIKVVQRRMALGAMSEEEGARELGKLGRIVDRLQAERELAEPSVLAKPSFKDPSEVLGEAPAQARELEPAGGLLARRATDQQIEDALRSQEISLGQPRQTVGEPFRPPETPQQYNVHKLPIPDSAKPEIARLLNEEAARIAKSGSGVTITWKETVAAAEDMARRTHSSIDEILERFQSRGRRGEILSDPELVLTHSLMGSTEQSIRDTANALAKATDPAEIERLTTAANAYAERYVGLLEVSAGSGSKAGRSLNLHRMLMDSLDAPAFQRRALVKKYRERLTPEAISYLQRMDPEDPAAYAQFLSHLKAGNFSDYAFTYWISSILSGVGTAGRNLIGNTTRLLMEMPVRPVRAALDLAASKIAGRPREFYFREAIPDAVAIQTGASQGFRKAVKILASGGEAWERGKLSPPRNPWLYLRTGKPKADAALKVAGTAIDVPFRGLSGVDAVYRTMAEIPEAHRLALRQALKDGLKPGTEEFAGRVDLLLKEMPEDLTAQVALHGQKMTFTDPVSPPTRWLLQGRNVKGIGPVIKVMATFARIADRITAAGVEFTPLGAGKLIYKYGQKARRVGLRKALDPEVVDLASRLAIGSSITGGLLAWAHGEKEQNPDFPRLVAWMPRDPKEREAAYARGIKPWSLRVGDAYVPFQQIEPLSFPLAAAAVILSEESQAKERLPGYQATEMSLGMARFFLDKTYVQGFARLLDAIDDEQGGGKIAFNQAARTAQGLVPFSAFLRDISKLVGDDAVRDPDTILQALMSGTPLLSQRVPARVDSLGQDVERTPGGSFPERLRGLFGGTPLAFTKIPELYSTDELPRWSTLDEDEKLGVVRVELDKAGIHPSLMERRLCVNGTSKTLDRGEFREYQRRAGQEQADAVQTVLGHDRYRRMKPEDRADWLREEINAARRRARQAQFGYGAKVGRCRGGE